MNKSNRIPKSEIRNPHSEFENPNSIKLLEIQMLLEAVFQYTGYDFREYSSSTLNRRIKKRVQTENLSTITGLQEKVLHDAGCMDRFLSDLSINVSEFFRDPGFYLAFREVVVPFLKTYPTIRIWHAGCASGEEAYSMAILLKEEGLYNRCKIYATDMNESAVRDAEAGIYSLKSMQKFTANYQKAGGAEDFSKYYTAQYENALFNPELKKNMVFAAHNLVTDALFNEFNVIFCRNVMIFFNEKLRNHVHQLFYESLCRFGYLGLGDKEDIFTSPYQEQYEVVDKRWKIYRKKS